MRHIKKIKILIWRIFWWRFLQRVS